MKALTRMELAHLNRLAGHCRLVLTREDWLQLVEHNKKRRPATIRHLQSSSATARRPVAVTLPKLSFLEGGN